VNPQPIAADRCDCEPFVYVPAWWSSFLFQVLSPRELAVYTYIAMLGVPDGVSRPTVRQVQLDMGLQSDSVVFDAIRKLEDLRFIRRLRNASGGRNAYVRPTCETTLISLLENNVIDPHLRPVDDSSQKLQSYDVTDLADQGLRLLLGEDFATYAAAAPEDRRAVLLDLLRASLLKRERRASCVCVDEEKGT
jgi:hypothetical protein